MTLTHLDSHGKAQMVNVQTKAVTVRSATAEGFVYMGIAAYDALISAESAKGDVLGVARIAGIMAAKQTAQLIPLCHPIGLDDIQINFDISQPQSVRIEAIAKVSGKTGVEMEAMTAVSIAALTIYDMLKAREKGITIKDIRLIHKSGGKSGEWHAS